MTANWSMFLRSFEWCEALWNPSRTPVAADAVAVLTREHQRRDARDLRFKGEHLQVDISFRCASKSAGIPTGASGRSRLRESVASTCLTRRSISHFLQIFAQPAAVSRGQILLERWHLIADRIEEAACLIAPLLPLRIGAPVAEQPLEDDLRVVLHRQRQRGRLPRQRIAVGTGEAGVAAVQVQRLHRELDRRERRVLPHVLGCDLVDGRADERFVLLDRMRAAQEHRRRAHVVLGAAGILSGRRGDGSVGQIADHADAIAERFERLQGLGELEGRSLTHRRPLVHRRAVRNVDASETAPGRRRRLRQHRPCRHHRFEQRQRQRHAGTAQKRPPRQVLFRDERHGSVPPSYRFIWNGRLFTTPAMSEENR
jgi:hypothetical protein